jgi:hypothetical protein
MRIVLDRENRVDAPALVHGEGPSQAPYAWLLFRTTLLCINHSESTNVETPDDS